jgi:hypothetical protein
LLNLIFSKLFNRRFLLLLLLLVGAGRFKRREAVLGAQAIQSAKFMDALLRPQAFTFGPLK